ncbi:MAG TPA: hypothetical protein VGT24_02245 [Candidatus Acidoferrales bacterium]|nr:hypothetical protein [Candidatus Acidoferrales bacterium]
MIDENVVKGPGKSASGRIEYYNDSLQPLTVTLETRSFTVSDTGDLSYRPLDAAIHVKFSEMSFRIEPKQNYFVFYQAYADKLPSWFVVYATFGGFREKTEQGFRLQVQLPHTIYLLPKQDVQKQELVVKVAEYRPAEKKVVVRVENVGPAFGRVLEADVSSSRDKSTQGGFPIFPFSQRQLEIPWEGAGEPAKLQLHLTHFKVEQGVTSATP